MLVGGRRSARTSTSSAPLSSRSSRSKSQPSLQLAATDEGEGPGHGGDATAAAVLAPGCYPSVASRAHDDRSAWASSGRGSWGRASPRWRPRRASTWSCARASRPAPTPWWPALEKSLAKQVDRGKLDETAAKEIAARVTATDDLHALHDCDLVLESVVEDLAVKKELFTELDDIVKADGHPRHQHVDPPGGRAGRGHRAPVAGVRHPLLQPGADDEPRRGRPAAHRLRRDGRRRQGVRRRRAARTRSR